MPPFRDLQGQKFNRLTVFSRAPNGQRGRTRWLCLCSCGREITVDACDLRSGHTKSCGCFRDEKCGQLGKGTVPVKYDICGKICRCTVKNGKSFLIDTRDVDLLRPFPWSINNRGRVNGRVCNKTVVLSRYLLGVTDSSLVVDHINLDPTDNRRENLRICTYQENSRNNPSNGYSYHKEMGKWVAYINIGSFDTEEEARSARIKAEKLLFSEFAPKREASDG